MRNILKLIVAALLIGFFAAYEPGTGNLVFDWIHTGFWCIAIGVCVLGLLGLIYCFTSWVLDCIAIAVYEKQEGEDNGDDDNSNIRHGDSG